MKNYKGALIGCGFFSVNHLHAWKDVRGARISAICDTDPERLEKIGDQFGIEHRFETADELFAADQYDFVDIATAVQSHHSLVTLAASKYTPVICQKPFATNLTEAKDMVQSCELAGVPLMVHENFRWQSPIQAVRAVIDSGEIGAPFWGRFSFRSAYDVFSGQPYLAEGERFIIEDLGIHTLDIARFILGDVSSLTARTNRINPSIKGEDVATLLLDHKSGAHSIVDCSYATRLSEETFPQTLIEVDGEKGSIRLNAGYQLVITTQTTTRRVDVSPQLLAWASKPWHNIQESVLAIQQHWVDSLSNNVVSQTSGQDNLFTLALVEAAYESANSHRRVRLSELMNRPK